MGALLVGVVCFSVGAAAQEELPQIIPGERKVPVKKDLGPRAVGVLQLAANGKTSLVPIAILINGKFWDATVYKADPVPMALEPGTVYEVERTGSSLGLFTVNNPLHSRAANAQSPWIATGAWVPAGSEKPTKAHRADIVPVGIESTDAPPRLTRSGSETKQSPPAGTSPASTGTAPASAPSSTASQPTSSSSDEPPRLNRGSSAPAAGSNQTGSGQTGSGQSGPGQPGPGQSSPSTSTQPSGTQTTQNGSGSSTPAQTTGSSPEGASKTGSVKPANQENVPASDSGADAAGRPRLRRGKPVESFADEDVPGYDKPGAAPSTASAAKNSKPSETATPVQLIPAISDAGGPIPRSFAFEWLKDEEGERRQQIEALAKDQVRAYLAEQAKQVITAKPAAGARRKPPAKMAEPILENEKMTAYDLWTTNQPVLVFSAEAHMPAPPAGTAHAEPDSELHYSILLVAYPDIYNNLHKLYAGVTDKYHLDVTPKLELVDVVDADGDGRGELLFRETSDAGTGWAIYRATADTLWKMYDSLSPE